MTIIYFPSFFLLVGESESFEAPAEVLDALIELAYTSKLNLTGGNMDTIGQLWRIASNYDITSLKQELSCHIKSTLSLSNALEFFKYAIGEWSMSKGCSIDKSIHFEEKLHGPE